MDRLIRMAINMLMRHGVRRLAKFQKKPEANTRQAQQAVRNVNRIGRM